MKITVLAGGVGGARFLRGLRSAAPNDDVTAIVNVGDDMWLAGLRICPDLDSIMYTLAGENDEERGWGRVGESERVSAELLAYGVGWPWFTLGDLDLGTHIARTQYLRSGIPLSEATSLLTAAGRSAFGSCPRPTTKSRPTSRPIRARCTFKNGGLGTVHRFQRERSSFVEPPIRGPRPAC